MGCAPAGCTPEGADCVALKGQRAETIQPLAGFGDPRGRAQGGLDAARVEASALRCQLEAFRARERELTSQARPWHVRAVTKYPDACTDLSRTGSRRACARVGVRASLTVQARAHLFMPCGIAPML